MQLDYKASPVAEINIIGSNGQGWYFECTNRSIEIKLLPVLTHSFVNI